jgi:hypothetical protein
MRLSNEAAGVHLASCRNVDCTSCFDNRAIVGRHAAAWCFVSLPDDDVLVSSLITPFLQALLELGWVEGTNIRIDYRWPKADLWAIAVARVYGHLAVGRLGARSDADLAWETELLQHLDREGLTVPVPIPTTDGRLFADGLVVMTYVEGGPPETEADWRRVADTLRRLHRLTRGWPQRPGWRSSTDLLHAETGTKIDLGAMPPEGVARCRAAWARLIGRQTCVVHGDPNPRNIRMTADRVALIDWDEAHVDVPDLDLVMPHNAAGLDDEAHDIAAQAWAAWEAAVCWDDEHSVKRLVEVRAV